MECTIFDNRSDCTLYPYPETQPTLTTNIDPCAAVALSSYLDPTLVNWDMSYMDPLLKMDLSSGTSQDSPQFPESSIASMVPPIDTTLMLPSSYIPPQLMMPSFSSAHSLTPPSADYFPIIWEKQPDLNHTMLSFSSAGDSLTPSNLMQAVSPLSNTPSPAAIVDSPPQNSKRMASLPPEEVAQSSDLIADGKPAKKMRQRRHTISTTTVLAQRKSSVSSGRSRRSSQSMTPEEIEGKKLARLERNRLAACKSRQKRKMLTDDQLTAIKLLTDDTSNIEEHNSILQAKLAALTDALNRHRCNSKN